MTPTAELGTVNSMPGNIALGSIAPQPNLTLAAGARAALSGSARTSSAIVKDRSARALLVGSGPKAGVR